MSDSQPSQLEFTEASEVFAQLQPGSAGEQIDRAEIIADGIRRLAAWCLRLLIIAAATFVLWYCIKQVWRGALPIILALIVTTVLWPPAAWLRRRGVPPGFASLMVILSAFGSFCFVIWVVAPSVGRQSQTLYFQAFEGVQRAQLWLQGPPLNLDPEDLNDRINYGVQWLQNRAGVIAGEIFSGLGVATSVLVTTGVVLILTFFFLKDGDRFLPWLRDVVGKRAGWHLTELLTRAWTALSAFIRAQAIVSAVDAIFIGVGLVVLGVPMALALGVLTFIAGFIPIVGAFVAGSLAVLVTLVSLGVTKAIVVLLIVVLVQQLEGNILSPLLHSRAVNLHPVIVLVSVTIGGSLFNIIGAFLAVPFAAMVAVLFRYIHDMTSLRAGEKTAAEITFVTTAGTISGALGEAMGKKLRADRQANSVLIDAPSPPPAPSTAEPAADAPRKIIDSTKTAMTTTATLAWKILKEIRHRKK